MAAVSADDAWAVGAVVEHWDGHLWTLVRLPHRRAGDSYDTVAADGADDVWIGGSTILYERDGTINEQLMYHWNGHHWTRMVTGALFGVRGFAFSGGTAWAGYLPLERWTGSQWTYSAKSTPIASNLSPYGMAAMGTSVWEVGLDSSSEKPMTARWDGSRWRVTHLPIRKPFGWLDGVSHTSNDSLWAVGSYGLPRGLPDSYFAGSLIEHWNGKSWTVYRGPHTRLTNELNDVSALSDGDAWAGGSYASSDGTESHNLVEFFHPCR